MKLYEIDMFEALFHAAQGDQATDYRNTTTIDSLNLRYMIMHAGAFGRLKTMQKECFLCTN